MGMFSLIKESGEKLVGTVLSPLGKIDPGQVPRVSAA